jgi:hypothetical protein
MRQLAQASLVALNMAGSLLILSIIPHSGGITPFLLFCCSVAAVGLGIRMMKRKSLGRLSARAGMMLLAALSVGPCYLSARIISSMLER